MQQTNLDSLEHRRRLERDGCRRSFARAGAHRGARRASDPLRQDVSDRDPRSPNIGLIGYLSTFAAVDDYGFLQTPYRKVENGKLTDEIEYLSADEEEEFTIAQANTPTDPETGKISEDAQILARRKGGDVATVAADEVDYVDVAPLQTVSVLRGLIPFLEHDDAGARRWDPVCRSRRCLAPQRGTVRRDRHGVQGGRRRRRRAACATRWHRRTGRIRQDHGQARRWRTG